MSPAASAAGPMILAERITIYLLRLNMSFSQNRSPPSGQARGQALRDMLYRGWVQTLSSAGWPDFTTATACFIAGPSSAGSLIGPFAHHPMDSASL